MSLVLHIQDELLMTKVNAKSRSCSIKQVFPKPKNILSHSAAAEASFIKNLLYLKSTSATCGKSNLYYFEDCTHK